MKSGGAIEGVITAMDSSDIDEAEESKATLLAYGEGAIEPLIAAVPGLRPYGQLLAIEVFTAVGDIRAGEALIPLLRSEADTVREYSAQALGELGVLAAVPELRLAYDRLKLRGVPLEWTEAESIRTALSALGARSVVMPPRVEALSRRAGPFKRCWTTDDLSKVLSDLAAEGQLVLHVQFWKRSGDVVYSVESPSWSLDWLLPWNELVTFSLAAAIEAAIDPRPPTDTVATISWMDESDR